MDDRTRQARPATTLQDDQTSDHNLVDSAPQALEELFGLDRNHRLESVKETEKIHGQTVRTVTWLAEYDASNTLIGHFKLWRERTHTPPYRRCLGWERFDSEGELMDREVRYTRRADMAWLH